MNTQTAMTQLPRVPRLGWSPRLVSAEFLKLRKRRGLVLSTLALTVVSMSIRALFAGQDGPAGGMENFVGSMDLLWGMSVIAAILIGATLGTGDLGAGVFRELVVTGRSRLALFAARVPAGLALLLPVVGAGFAVAAAISTVFTGSQAMGYAEGFHGDPGALILGNAAPSGSTLLESAAWLALVAATSMVLALGVSSAFNSRGTAIGILLGWFLVVMPLLFDPALRLGSLRQALWYAAIDRLKPDAFPPVGTPISTMSLMATVVVLLGWTIAPLVVGAWRTCTRDA